MQGFNTAVKLVDVLFMCLQPLQCSRSVCVQISNVTLVVFQACVYFFEVRFEASISVADFGDVFLVVSESIVRVCCLLVLNLVSSTLSKRARVLGVHSDRRRRC
jgi:hypothetical protein